MFFFSQWFFRGRRVSLACPIQMVLQLDASLQTTLFKLEVKFQQHHKCNCVNSVLVKETQLREGGRKRAKSPKGLRYMRQRRTWLLVAGAQVAHTGQDPFFVLLAWHMERAPGGDRSDLYAEQELHRGCQKETTGTSDCCKSSCSMVPEAGLDRRLLHPHRLSALDLFPLVSQNVLTEILCTSLESEVLPPCSLLPEERSYLLRSTPFNKEAPIWEYDAPTQTTPTPGQECTARVGKILSGCLALVVGV